MTKTEGRDTRIISEGKRLESILFLHTYLFPNEANREVSILNALGSVTSALAGTELFALQRNLSAKRLHDM